MEDCGDDGTVSIHNKCPHAPPIRSTYTKFGYGTTL